VGPFFPDLPFTDPDAFGPRGMQPIFFGKRFLSRIMLDLIFPDQREVPFTSQFDGRGG